MSFRRMENDERTNEVQLEGIRRTENGHQEVVKGHIGGGITRGRNDRGDKSAEGFREVKK